MYKPFQRVVDSTMMRNQCNYPSDRLRSVVYLFFHGQWRWALVYRGRLLGDSLAALSIIYRGDAPAEAIPTFILWAPLSRITVGGAIIYKCKAKKSASHLSNSFFNIQPDTEV